MYNINKSNNIRIDRQNIKLRNFKKNIFIEDIGRFYQIIYEGYGALFTFILLLLLLFGILLLLLILLLYILLFINLLFFLLLYNYKYLNVKYLDYLVSNIIYNVSDFIHFIFYWIYFNFI